MNLFHGDLFRSVDSLDLMADRGIEGTIFARPRQGARRRIHRTRRRHDRTERHLRIAGHDEAPVSFAVLTVALRPGMPANVALPTVAVITDAMGTTGDPMVATVGETRVTEVDYGPLVSLPLQCVSSGETTAELTYTLDDVGDDILIASWLELPATAVEIGIVGSIECFE